MGKVVCWFNQINIRRIGEWKRNFKHSEFLDRGYSDKLLFVNMEYAVPGIVGVLMDDR
jgi:hypothetical protein